MGNIQKVGDDYFIEFYARGLKYQQKIGPDKEAAQKALETIESQISRGEAAIIVREVEHVMFFHDFLNFIKESHSKRTIERFESLVGDFQGFLRQEYPSAIKLSEITPKVAEHYKSFLSKPAATKGPLKPKLINFSLFLLRDVFEYAIKLGYLNDNPTLHTKLIKSTQANPTVLNDDELKQVFNAADSYLWFFIEFILMTGVRPEEIVDLTWDDIDWSQNCFKVKEERAREVAINARALDILKQLQNKKYKSAQFVFTDQSGKKLTMDKLRETLGRVVFQCGFKKEVNFHTFRHIFVRNLVKKGVTVSLLYKILGYRDIARIIIYSRFIADYWENDIYKV